jgi:hypothetical protein
MSNICVSLMRQSVWNTTYFIYCHCISNINKHETANWWMYIQLAAGMFELAPACNIFLHMQNIWELDSSISIAMGYVLDGQGWIPTRGKILLFFIASGLALRPTQPPIQWVPGTVSMGVKQERHEADHSPPSSAEVKNSGAITSHLQYIFMEWCLIN